MLIRALTRFLGAALEPHPKLLADGVGVDARNIRPGSGDMRPWNAADIVHTLPVGATQRLTIFNMPGVGQNWLSWTTDVDVVRGLLADDPTYRIYYTGDGVPKSTDNVLGLATPPYPTAFRTLGVPRPVGVISLTISTAGTAPQQETRAYVETFVNDRGEESAPNAAPQLVDCNTDATITVGNLSPVPGGSHGITLRRLYVSNGSDFRRFAEQPTATTTAVDNGTVRGDVLPSGGDIARPAWLEPPADLKGLINLWNGMVGGFAGKSVRICEVYKIWAWPIEYENLVPDNVVGTGTWDQKWLVLTTGAPRLFMGSSPGAMTEVPTKMKRSCRSKRGILSMGHGVAWPSEEGLAYVGQTDERLVTDGIFTPAQWQAMNPSTMTASRLRGWYRCSYTDSLGARRSFIIDVLNPTGVIYLDQGDWGSFYDEATERLYLIDTGNVIRQWDSGAPLTASFKDKITRLPLETNPGVARVIADGWPVQVTLWSERRNQQTGQTDVVQRFDKSVTSGEPFKLPPGYLSQDFQPRLASAYPVQGLIVAEDVDDLT